MHRFIIDVAARTSSNIITITLRVANQSKMLLFVPNVMLRARDHTRFLYSFNRLGHEDTGNHRIGAESFPVPASFWGSTERSSDGAELDVGSFGTEFPAHCQTAEVGEGSVPCCGDVDTGWEGGVVVAWQVGQFVICKYDLCVCVLTALRIVRNELTESYTQW